MQQPGTVTPVMTSLTAFLPRALTENLSCVHSPGLAPSRGSPLSPPQLQKPTQKQGLTTYEDLSPSWPIECSMESSILSCLRGRDE